LEQEAPALAAPVRQHCNGASSRSHWKLATSNTHGRPQMGGQIFKLNL
jgi:hypothetical protein